MPKRVDQTIRSLLEIEMSPYWRKLDGALIQEVVRGYRDWPPAKALLRGKGKSQDTRIADQLLEFLLHSVDQQRIHLLALRQQHADFSRTYLRASTPAAQRQAILDYAADLGATPAQLRGDRRAFSRWFGHDAITDRYLHQHAAEERRMVFYLQRLGVLAAHVLRLDSGTDGDTDDSSILWQRLNLERILKPLLSYEGDRRVAAAAFQCLSTALQALPQDEQEGSVTENTLLYIYRSALGSRQHIPIQRAALSLLQNLSTDSLQTALTTRLTHPHAGDDLFVRRHAVALVGENLPRLPDLKDLFPIMVEDPSPFVRQAVARALRRAPVHVSQPWLRQLACADSVPEVRAAALLEVLELLDNPDHTGLCLSILCESLERDTNSFVLRVALKVASDGQDRLLQTGAAALAQQWEETLWPYIDDVHSSAESLSVRRWAAQARERMWCHGDAAARLLRQLLEQVLALLQPGRSMRLPRHISTAYDMDMICRVLSVMAQEDFGYDIRQGLFGTQITRGHVFGFRIWRLLHECRHPSPDKRQAFRHTIGRIFRGQFRVPSGILSELAETKVPGEPLFFASEAGWRPYLPLVDEVLSSLDQSLRGRPIRIFTSEGITELFPPPSLLRRLWASVMVTWRFAHYARLRNWQEQSPSSPPSYLQALEQLGFRIHLTPHHTRKGDPCTSDPAVTRFFPAGIALVDPTLWRQLVHYFFSFYENSLHELGVFLSLVIAFFVGRHLYMNHMIHAIRRRLPLVIGGWGTRGKSGTERLKAALLNGLGYSIVSKTTGCEAMFLYAPPFRALRELFLFRPYDKATIWEQHNLVRLSDKLQSDIFLWECMALNPAFVSLLQRHWMRDDIATITNTYPDHEDIQGPAGINIPEVMTNFIPAAGVLATSEEQMLPILRAAAERLGTRIHTVGWLEAGLLAPDVLSRFPYEEHPYNIALVLAMAEELGIERDFALKEMADRVVPDLGVLKAYPPARMRSRHLEFVNGMSANERFGCLGNWTRMGFDTHDPETEPGVYITTVVNNRADRISRSRVFASILVADLRADRHFLIGSNLRGLQGYIQEAWDKYAQELTLWPASGESPSEVFDRLAQHMRIATTDEQIMARLRVMIQAYRSDPEPLLMHWQNPDDLRQALQQAGLGEQADDILHHLERETQAYAEFQALEARVHTAEASQQAQLDEDVRQILWTWFQRKIVVIEDYHASGNQIIDCICNETPPGFHNRIMGLQNIKGTGLDFVYRWQAWESCHRACTQLRSSNVQTATEGLQALAGFQQFNVLCNEHVRETLDLVQESSTTQNEMFQAPLPLIAANLERAMAKVQTGTQATHQTGFFTYLVESTEAFLDAGDAVRRRKMADKIYKDLIHERISQTRAILELQALTSRQKGGWLLKKLQSFQSRSSQPPESPS